MFRSRLRRLSVSEATKTAELENNNESIESSGRSFDIKLEDINPSSDQNSKSQNTKTSLRRRYKLVDLVVFAISNVVGSGIYVLAGSEGKHVSGPGLLLSLLFGLLSAGISAISYAQFASQFAIIGGYTYLHISSGEAFGFVIAVNDVINCICSASINAIGATYYLRSFIETLTNKINTESVYDILFGNYITQIISINIIAPIILLIFTILVLMDIKISAMTMNLSTTWNISLLCLFGISSLCMFDINIIKNPCDYNDIYTPESCPDNLNNSWLPFGFVGVAAASPVAFWAFSGSEMVTFMAQESINPTKDIPKSIYITLLIVFLLYEMIMLGIFGMVPYFSLNIDAPLSEAFAVHNETLLQQICAFGAFTTMCIILFATLIASPRMLYRMSVDGLLPKFLEYIHPKTGGAINAISVFCIIALLIAMFFDLESVLEFASISTLMSYTCVTTATLIINYCPKSLEKIYKNNKIGTDIQLTPFWTDMMIFKFIWLFLVIATLNAFIAVNYDFFNKNDLLILWIIIIAVLGSIILIQIVVIIYLDKILPWKDWIILKNGKKLSDITFVPFTPYTQCILIMFNSYMVASAGITDFAIWIAVVIVAILIYFLYGFKHSNMNPVRMSLL